MCSTNRHGWPWICCSGLQIICPCASLKWSSWQLRDCCGPIQTLLAYIKELGTCQVLSALLAWPSAKLLGLSAGIGRSTSPSSMHEAGHGETIQCPAPCVGCAINAKQPTAVGQQSLRDTTPAAGWFAAPADDSIEVHQAWLCHPPASCASVILSSSSSSESVSLASPSAPSAAPSALSPFCLNRFSSSAFFFISRFCWSTISYLHKGVTGIKSLLAHCLCSASRAVQRAARCFLDWCCIPACFYCCIRVHSAGLIQSAYMTVQCSLCYAGLSAVQAASKGPEHSSTTSFTQQPSNSFSAPSNAASRLSAWPSASPNWQRLSSPQGSAARVKCGRVKPQAKKVLPAKPGVAGRLDDMQGLHRAAGPSSCVQTGA